MKERAKLHSLQHAVHPHQTYPVICMEKVQAKEKARKPTLVEIFCHRRITAAPLKRSGPKQSRAGKTAHRREGR